MNYKNIATRELEAFRKEFDNYSITEILFAVLRLDGIVSKLSDILNITDEEFYHLVTEARAEEIETPFTPEEIKTYENRN